MPLMLTLHIVFLIIWSASLLYLPQLFVHHALAEDTDSQKQAIRMQGKLYAHIMTPSALLTVIAGIWLIFERGFHGGWLPVKLALVLCMVVFHTYCGKLLRELIHERVRHGVIYYRLLWPIPALLIIGVVTLVVSKPF
jgi:protoporphyrinogen IX oxidase